VRQRRKLQSRSNASKRRRRHKTRHSPSIRHPIRFFWSPPTRATTPRLFTRFNSRARFISNEIRTRASTDDAPPPTRARARMGRKYFYFPRRVRGRAVSVARRPSGRSYRVKKCRRGTARLLRHRQPSRRPSSTTTLFDESTSHHSRISLVRWSVDQISRVFMRFDE